MYWAPAQRILGRRTTDPEVASLAASLPYKLTELKAGEVLIEAETTGGAVLSKKPEASSHASLADGRRVDLSL